MSRVKIVAAELKTEDKDDIIAEKMAANIRPDSPVPYRVGRMVMIS